MRGSYFLAGLFIAVLHTGCLWGQFYSTGEAPASVRWNKISTPHFTIVFPSEIAGEAGKLAQKLEQYKKLTEEDLLHTVKKFPVLLHNTSILSNGYVTLAPKRMELVSVPPQDAYAQDWITQLALHEYRHVVQLSKMNQGFTHALSWLTGEIAAGGISSQIPSWFYEGDAVYNETRLSPTGRGRIAGFEMPLRTILLENPRPYSYDKAVFGSYKDYVPDHYRIGYQIVNYARSCYGPEIWEKAINYTARNPFYVWPLAFYLKKNYGFYKSGLYNKTLDSLKIQYNKQEDSVNYINYVSKNSHEPRVFTNYILPKDLGNGKTVVIRTGKDDSGSFVVLDAAGRENRILRTGYTMDLDFDVHGSLLVWDEINSDIRWERRDYSVLSTFDLGTGKLNKLTSRTRYFSPDFSPKGDRIAVAETDLKNRNFITLLDASTGEKLMQVPTPDNKVIQFPEWIGDSVLVAITVSDEGKQLEYLDLHGYTWKVLLHHTFVDISEPVNYKKYILFRGSFNGIENIYAIHRSTDPMLYQVTFSRFGAYHPSVSADSSMLLFSDYNKQGFRVTSIPLDTSTWQVVPDYFNRADHATQQEKSVISGFAEKSEQATYPIEPYRKFGRLFNFHSWLPFFANLEDYTEAIRSIPVNLGVMVFSQNLLSTSISSIGYRYYDGYHEFTPRLTWRGWYPVFELSGQFNGPVDKIKLKSYVPLVFNRGKYISGIQPLVEYEYAGIGYMDGDERKTGIQYLHYKLYLSHYLRLSQRDLYPRFGQYLAAGYTQTPADDEVFGSLGYWQAGIFLPGIALHHHFYVQAGMQRQQPEMYYLPVNRISFPRGYESYVSRQMNSLFLNYAFPVAYPDFSAGPLLYLKRLRVNLFHDWSYGKDIREIHGGEVVSYTGDYRSYGAEIQVDMHIMRIIFPISAGVRLGYLPGRDKFFSELMFSMDTGVF